MIEEWRDVYNGWYEVSNTGHVKRKKQTRGAQVGRICTEHEKDDYLKVSLSFGDGKSHFKFVHILVAFIGPCPKGKEVNHKDGNKKNNLATNLEYVTHLRNIRHAYELGLVPVAENHHKSKLNWKIVNKIRREYPLGFHTYRSLASKYGVAIRTIAQVVTKVSWQEI